MLTMCAALYKQADTTTEICKREYNSPHMFTRGNANLLQQNMVHLRYWSANIKTLINQNKL